MGREDPSDAEVPRRHILRTLMDPKTRKRISLKSLKFETDSVVVAAMNSTDHQLVYGSYGIPCVESRRSDDTF